MVASVGVNILAIWNTGKMSLTCQWVVIAWSQEKRYAYLKNQKEESRNNSTKKRFRERLKSSDRKKQRSPSCQDGSNLRQSNNHTTKERSCSTGSLFCTYPSTTSPDRCVFSLSLTLQKKRPAIYRPTKHSSVKGAASTKLICPDWTNGTTIHAGRVTHIMKTNVQLIPATR